MSTYEKMTKASKTKNKMHPIGTKVYMANVIDIKTPPILHATVSGYNEDKGYILEFELDSITEVLMNQLCPEPLLVEGLDRMDEINVREAVHEARMVRLLSLAQHRPLLSPQYFGNATKDIVEKYCTIDNRGIITNELYRNINTMIKEVNNRTIESLNQRKPPPKTKTPPKLPKDTRPIDNNLYQNLIEYATKKTKTIDQQYKAYENDESEIPPTYRKAYNKTLFDLLNYDVATQNQQQIDQEEASHQPTIINPQMELMIKNLFYQLNPNATIINQQTTRPPENIEFTTRQPATPLTTKTAASETRKPPPTQDTPTTTQRPRRNINDTTYQEDDDFGDIELEGTAQLPYPTLKRISNFAKGIKDSKFGQLPEVSNLKDPLEYIIAYVCYIMYIVGKMTSSNMKLVEKKDTWVTAYTARRHVINGFYAGYNVFKNLAEDSTNSKNVHMTDMENSFLALLSMLRATAYGLSDQNFLTIMSGEPQTKDKWKELYKQLIGVKPIQDAEYDIVRILRSEQYLERDNAGNWKLPSSALACFKNERYILQGLNGLAPQTPLLEEVKGEDEGIEDEKNLIIQWDRYDNVPSKRKSRASSITSKRPPKKQLRSSHKQAARTSKPKQQPEPARVPQAERQPEPARAPQLEQQPELARALQAGRPSEPARAPEPMQRQVPVRDPGLPPALAHQTYRDNEEQSHSTSSDDDDNKNGPFQIIRLDDDDEDQNPINNIRRQEEIAALGLLEGAQGARLNEIEDAADDDETEDDDV
jgi:hypothetical protein